MHVFTQSPAEEIVRTYRNTFFFEQKRGLEDPSEAIIAHVAGRNYKKILLHLSHRETRNLKKVHLELQENTIEQKVEKQSGPWVSPPPPAGDLKTFPPRYDAEIVQQHASGVASPPPATDTSQTYL
jgi:hypothetical protein